METPESMRAALAEWNGGDGIDLEEWVGGQGNFALAVGYTSVFWPEFVEFEGYILRKDFSEGALRGFENQDGSDKCSLEWVMNHLHISELHYWGCGDASPDKFIILGETLADIYRVKLKARFPSLECAVEFYRPDDPDDLIEYQVSFWRVRDAEPPLSQEIAAKTGSPPGDNAAH